MDQSSTRNPRQTIQWLGLFLGPVAALILGVTLPESFTAPDGGSVDFSPAGRATLAVMAWMAVWWLTEAVHVSVTALLPLVLFPLSGAQSMNDAASPYASSLIFLFMGGFLLAISMQRWQLDQRIAIVTLRRIGTRPRSLVAGFMAVTAVLSAFVSNTATAAMMLPIALSVIALVAPAKGDSDTRHPLASLNSSGNINAKLPPSLVTNYGSNDSIKYDPEANPDEIADIQIVDLGDSLEDSLE